MSDAERKTVSVIMTVKNDAPGCAVTLRSLAKQTRKPDEIVVSDGGSTDRTAEIIQGFAGEIPGVRIVEARRANIARGRNIAARAAVGDLLACIDAGCRAEPEWLERLVTPFERDPNTSLVAGFYRIEPQSLLEHVVGLATMRGQLEPVDPERFNPSARSMACTKTLWERVGGWPEWIGFSEDTLFDRKVREMKVGWHFAGDAVVHWRPRGSLRSIARQFYHYGTGRGHTQIGAADFHYGLRNAAIVITLLIVSLAIPWCLPLLAVALGFFYWWTFHDKAIAVSRRTVRRRAYPLCLCVLWLVHMSHIAGYCVGSWQRRRDPARYRDRQAAYLSAA